MGINYPILPKVGPQLNSLVANFTNGISSRNHYGMNEPTRWIRENPIGPQN